VRGNEGSGGGETIMSDMSERGKLLLLASCFERNVAVFIRYELLYEKERERERERERGGGFLF